ncbi:MAG: hypothetical protein JJLCMIEE_01091 [Acidimicrobiales bacterium]|nr:hypothetical protein [Acidimicrobiales bacterium]
MSSPSADPSTDPSADPLHQHSPPGIWWTTANVAEAIPGVPTPLGWTFWSECMEYAAQWSFSDVGLIPRAAVEVSPPMEDRFAAIFFGRVATNIDLLARVAAAFPGSSPEAFEQQFFGSARPGLEIKTSRSRYAAVATKLPLAVALLPRRLAALRAESETYWRACVTDRPGDVAAGRRRLVETTERFKNTVRYHAMATLLAQALYEQVGVLAELAGRPGLEMSLASGLGGLEEVAVATDLWDVARKRLALETFLQRHGFHGPEEGELSSRSWREEPGPLRLLLGTYESMAEDRSPSAAYRRQVAEREAAEAELMASLRGLTRQRARLVLKMARRYIPLREVGKTSFLQLLDVVRSTSRAIGEGLAAGGGLGAPDDVFMLTLDEVLHGAPAGAGELVGQRRQQWEKYHELRIPERFQGQPVAERVGRSDATAVGGSITGVPVSPGLVEGTARVITDPAACEPLVDGEILVARTTDPSWVSMFLTAGGLVIDIGGAMSHGAIVARELGIPCVIGTESGTERLRSGDRLRVDGNSGEVQVIGRDGVNGSDP